MVARRKNRFCENVRFLMVKLIFSRFRYKSLQSLGLQKWMQKATWKKDAKICAKKSFGLEIWCSWLRFRRPGARPGRPKSGPRRPQELGAVASRALCDALGCSWALFCFLLRLSLNFGQFFVDFCYEKIRNDLYPFTSWGGGIPRWPSQAKPSQATAPSPC